MSAQGKPFTLAAGLALLSYVPFEYVAKGTLILCAFLFIVDPFPPLSRFVAIISLLVVAGLSRLHKEYASIEDENGVQIATDVSREKAGKTE